MDQELGMNQDSPRLRWGYEMGGWTKIIYFLSYLQTARRGGIKLSFFVSF